jgi:hypothetical protein
MTPEQRFPVIRTDQSVPWAVVAPHEAQAKRNHGQTLERLAQRGGLDWGELLRVLEDRTYTGQGLEPRAEARVLAHVAQFYQAALAAREAEMAGPVWQPIETAPITGGITYIGAHINERGVNVVQLCAGDWSKGPYGQMTHWMPLPLPPPPAPDMEACRTCHGLGRLTPARVASHGPCPDCNGTGHSGNLHDELCATCAGGGRIASAPEGRA